jgi:hypothetical protein
MRLVSVLGGIVVLLLVAVAHAGDQLDARPNPSGATDVRDLQGRVILQGTSSLRGQTFRDLNGHVIVETRPSLDGVGVELDGEEDTDE